MSPLGKALRAADAKRAPKAPKQSGYTDCACRDCFEIAISSDVANPVMCQDCAEAGCERGSECQAPGAYGGEG